MVDHILKECLLWQQEESAEALIPGMMGSTGSGKTARAIQAAKALDLPVIRWLLNQELPEDIGGYPRVTRDPELDRDVAEFILQKHLWLAIKRGCLILIDEVDKVKPEVVATVLTLCSDRVIRGEKLHSKTVMVVAGQPVEPTVWLADETNQAFAARCCWLPVGHNWDFVSESVRLPLKWLKDRKQNEIKLPVLPANPRTIERATKFLYARGVNLSPEERRVYLLGCMAIGDVEGLLDELGASKWIDVDAAFKADINRALKTMTDNDLADNAYKFLRWCTDENAAEAMLQRIMYKGTSEHRRQFMKSLLEGFKADAPNVGDQVEILKGIDDGAVTEMFRKAIIAAREADEAETKAGAVSVAKVKGRKVTAKRAAPSEPANKKEENEDE